MATKGSHPITNTIFVGDTPNRVSFSGCGFLGVYHIGVACCLKEHAPNWVSNLDRVYGCSAGSFIGAMLLSDVCFGELCQHTMDIVMEARSYTLGPLSPRFKLYQTLLNGFRKGLPEDAHLKANGKLFVSLTRVHDLQNVIVSEYSSREELIQVLMCSSFVPFYSGVIPPKYRGVRYVDGGLTNNLPSDVHTITVSPWSGSSDICPRNDEQTSLIDLSFVNQSIQMTASNLYRLSIMFLPPHPKVLEDFCKQGFRETVQYLRDHGLFETKHHVRQNISFSSKLRHVKLRRRKTRRLSRSARYMHLQDAARDSGKKFSFENWDTSSFFNEVFDGSSKSNLSPVVEECFEFDDNANALGDFSSPSSNELRSLDVFTVIHVYPIERDHELRIQVQLPTPVLEALDAALNRSNITWKRPLAKILSVLSHSFVVRIPFDRVYSLARFLLRRVEAFPTDVQWLVEHLQCLVRKFHFHFKCAEQLLIEQLQIRGKRVKEETVFLAQQLNVVVQLLLNTLSKRGIPFYPCWLLPCIAQKM